MSTRRYGATLLAALIAVAGCAGVPGPGDDDLTFVADPVSVADDAVAASGYEVEADERVSFDRAVTVGERSQQVTVEAHVIHLQQSYRDAPLAHVVVLSLPELRFVGQQVDLAERFGATSLVTTAQDSVTDVETDRSLPSRSATILGADRTVDAYRATAEQDGDRADVILLETSFEYEESEIVAVAVYPREVEGGDASALALFEGVRME